jgi:His-Xaa-Ser system radical SAM maturase HxsC
MLPLGTRDVTLSGFEQDHGSIVVRLRGADADPRTLLTNEAWLNPTGDSVGHTVVAIERNAGQAFLLGAGRRIVLPDDYDYLGDGDVLGVSLSRPSIRVLYRRNSPHNSFLLTERCNHYCLMCSQPPRDIDDDWLVDELLAAIPLVDKETTEIGFTGGEPTLLGTSFLRLVESMRDNLPATALHILSNGRKFCDPAFARAYAGIGHHDAMLGIPVYAPSSQVHDYVVQADGAFDETIRGILNLKSLGQKVELRVVIHRQNYRLLPALAEFVARNLTFVDHVALMGLEMTGFAKANIEELWIDPFEYQGELFDAASILDDLGLRTSIYNHQLCTIDRRIWPLTVRSISDWKNEYVDECALCSVRDQCGGFFGTGRIRRSAHIRAFPGGT